MPTGRGLSGSQVKFATGLSYLAVSAAGSGGPSNFAAYGFGTVIVAADSADLATYLQRSTTSNGTFNGWGCSLQSVASGLAVRSFKMGSPNWLRVAYDNANAGSVNAVIILEMQEARDNPVDQESNVTVSSTVLSS